MIFITNDNYWINSYTPPVLCSMDLVISLDKYFKIYQNLNFQIYLRHSNFVNLYIGRVKNVLEDGVEMYRDIAKFCSYLTKNTQFKFSDPKSV